MSSSLRPEHRALIEGSAISPEVADARGYRSVVTMAELERLGFARSQRRVPALLIPLHDVHGQNGRYQIRPNDPRLKRRPGREPKPVKYETPSGDRVTLDILPLTRSLLMDPAIPLFITEGVRKGDAAATLGLCCIALTGVWNWRGTNERGGKTALPDWNAIALNERRVYLVFDSDAWENPSVHLALSELRKFLRTKTADVRIVYLPPTEHGGKQGLDDYLAAGGTKESLLALASTEVRPAPARTADEEDAEKTDDSGVSTDDFRAYMPDGSFIYMHTVDFWPATSVDARCGRIPTGEVDEDGRQETEAASRWLARERPVEQMTWAPGLPQLIEGRLLVQSGWIERAGCTVFNLYIPPVVGSGDPNDVEPWARHMLRLYGQEQTKHIVYWLAHRVQRPGEKINHALVLGGDQGIGKDTLLEPLRYAVGGWNFQDVSPIQVLGRFNGFRKSVVLRISEARDLGETDRYAFYEHLKTLTAAPPDYLPIDEKNRQEYAVPNVCGVILTTNHRTGGLYLPPDDRRHYVAWSDALQQNLPADCCQELWRWYETGGRENVAAFLAQRDLSGFDPKAPPPKTDAFWVMVDAGAAPEDAELRDALEALGWPKAVAKEMILAHDLIPLAFKDWLRDRGNARRVGKRFEACGYVPFRNPDQTDGRWTVAGKNVVVYVERGLNTPQRYHAVGEMTKDRQDGTP